MGWVRGETLGKGGFGFVSMANTNQEDNLPPLITVKSAKFSESESLRKEKMVLDKFQSCPFIHCFGDSITTENGEKLYNILLEYASGGCLANLIIIKAALPEITVSRCTKSILSALLHIHKAGYVHCDMKPHNVLLVGQDAKLADFGSCCKSFNNNSNCDDFKGTVIYAAPESIAQQKYGPESDVWALGSSVLHMLTGKPPWAFDSKAQPKDVLFKIGCSDQNPHIPTNNRISKEAKDFLAKCLVKDPTARWKVDMLLDHPFSTRPIHQQLLENTIIIIIITIDCVMAFTLWCLTVFTTQKCSLLIYSSGYSMYICFMTNLSCEYY
ncbi:protein kinase-like protein [Striga asiatica]|uniref:Protein kinase-like protein n=1 Tax=Striga asiatica TaxID=4170 RepID=A0A5A7NX16_STRAF|nr:protein kinase-like protein [Striga asiatica]